MCGVKTNVVTAVEIHERNTHDTTQFVPLVNATAKQFKIAEVSADKIYGTVDNLNAVASHDATPYVPFKKQATGHAGGFWAKCFHFFQFQREEFLGHYHKRSNIESTMSMVKRKFGDSLRSKTDTAMVNETLCKILCHNIVVLIHEMHELGIDPTFWSSKEPEANLIA
jgi:transposase